MYVTDTIKKQDQILHFSSDGKLLAREGVSDSVISADARGTVYFVRHGVLHEITPDGVSHARWHVGTIDVAMADDHGHLFTFAPTFDGNHESVVEYATAGRRLARWSTPYKDAFTVDDQGYIWAMAQISGLATAGIARLFPSTGRVLTAFSYRTLSIPSALGRDPQGTIYIGDTNDTSEPFQIVRLSRNGASTYHMDVLDRAQESPSMLAVDSKGDIYVGRSSYSRTGNYGIDELSPQGDVIATFQPCHPDG